MIIYKEVACLEDIIKADLILYSINKKDLINRKFINFERILEILQKAGKDARGKLMLTFDGYDNDDREIYFIPEIREFVKYFYDKCNYLFYFLTTGDNNRSIIFACINDCSSFKVKGGNKVILETIYDQEIKMKTINSIIKYGLSQNDFIEAKRLLYTFI